MRTIKQAFMSGILLTAMASAVHAEVKTNTAQGDYLEARSASVYVGGCHYSNEAVTAGKTATLAWRFKAGQWNGVALSGLNAVAILDSAQNLADNAPDRQTVLYLDAKATPAQATALRSLFTQKYSTLLGHVAAIKPAAIDIHNDGLDYHVSVDKVAQLDVNRYPCQHCTEDFQIWYQPFVEAQDVLVGKTTHTAYHDSALNTSWDDSQEANSAFVGTFTI